MWLFWLFALIVVGFGFVVFFGAPYVPSKKRELDEAFERLYPLSKKDVLVDIGSGDGIVLRRAAGRGARAIGFELNPMLVGLSRFFSRGNKKIQTRLANFWFTPLPDETTIVYVFAVSRDIRRLSRKIQRETDRLSRPLKLISYGCNIPDKTPVKTLGAHQLYDFIPLQGKQT